MGRVFARLDPNELEQCLLEYVRCLQVSLEGRTVAIDGKAVRRSYDNECGVSCTHMITAWVDELRTVLGVISTDKKSNEIPAVQQLLALIDLKGAVVTADAMHCQKKTAATIVSRKADYVLQLKKNQRSLFSRVETIFEQHTQDQFRSRHARSHLTEEENRGRHESRLCVVCPAPAELKSVWAGLKTIGMIHRVTEMPNGKERREVSYFISSLPPNVRVYQPHVRRHWSVENTVHYTLDVTFAEDDSRIRKGNAAKNISILRRLILSILKQDNTIKDNVRGKRKRIGWNPEHLDNVLSNFTAI